jgi:hypothetical protein
MRRVMRLKIDPIKIHISQPEKSNYAKYVTFISGSLLAISESLPYFDNVNGNGILHVISNILKEYKEDVVYKK